MHTASHQSRFNDKSNTSSRTRAGVVGSLMFILSSFSLFCFVTLGDTLGGTLVVAQGDTLGVANTVAPKGGDMADDAGLGVSQGVA